MIAMGAYATGAGMGTTYSNKIADRSCRCLLGTRNYRTSGPSRWAMPFWPRPTGRRVASRGATSQSSRARPGPWAARRSTTPKGRPAESLDTRRCHDSWLRCHSPNARCRRVAQHGTR